MLKRKRGRGEWRRTKRKKSPRFGNGCAGGWLHGRSPIAVPEYYGYDMEEVQGPSAPCIRSRFKSQ
jgi:hypothetical protein